jgi:dipeptidyl aminopeptidase/acylaminoacyl peptidase
MSAKPFGSWDSPITSEHLTKDKVRFGTVHVFQDAVYWTESRPNEKGRGALMRFHQGKIEEALPSTFNVRTRVHEYGGNCYAMCNDTLVFSSFPSNNLYFFKQSPEQITKDENMRYADPHWSEKRNTLFLVCEDHNNEGEPGNYLVSLEGKKAALPKKIAAGHDFYSSPIPSPEGTHLAWISWNHPNMPWDGTELWMAKFDENGSLVDPILVAGGLEESILEPKWGKDGSLYFLSDRSGWWNLYRKKGDKIEALHPMEAEFGIPKWLFGMNRYDFIDGGKKILCIYTMKGSDYLATIDLETKAFTPIACPYTTLGELAATSDGAVFIGSNAKEPASIVYWKQKDNEFTVIKSSGQPAIDPSYFSVPEFIEFPTEGGKTAYALFYPPTNPQCTPKKGELPPLLVLSHGGPTAHVTESLNLKIQFWTSRGFAVMDVNYGGSTGFGRAYRERLKRNWGVVDVDDCTNAALYLAKIGKVDRNRLAISGGSAGGYTTLASLTFKDCFKAGASYYGVSNLIALAEDTHKFESRYLDKLVGPYPEKEEIYKKRSPLYHTEQLSCPIILLQGSEDKIVPPNQSQAMHVTLKEKKIPTAYLLFEGEQHGFRNAENIRRAIEAEYYFYSQIFHFEPTSDVHPIAIDNLGP